MFPLQGMRILVTPTREQGGVLSDQLRALGTTPIEFLTIRIMPSRNWEPLDDEAKAFTSADMVESIL